MDRVLNGSQRPGVFTVSIFLAVEVVLVVYLLPLPVHVDRLRLRVHVDITSLVLLEEVLNAHIHRRHCIVPGGSWTDALAENHLLFPEHVRGHQVAGVLLLLARVETGTTASTPRAPGSF